MEHSKWVYAFINSIYMKELNYEADLEFINMNNECVFRSMMQMCIHGHKHPSVYHLIVQLFVELSDLLLVFLPLLLRDVNHYGGG